MRHRGRRSEPRPRETGISPPTVRAHGGLRAGDREPIGVPGVPVFSTGVPDPVGILSSHCADSEWWSSQINPEYPDDTAKINRKKTARSQVPFESVKTRY